jgi:uncharacterized protein with HEPN domain
MHSKAVRAALSDIKDNIELARSFVAGSDFARFKDDLKTFYAATRCLEIISEASRRLPIDMKGRYPGIEWQRIANAGNVYRHEYDNVAEQRVWTTLHEALPALLAVIDQELAA